MSQHDRNREAIQESIYALEEAESKIAWAADDLKEQLSQKLSQKDGCESINACKKVLSGAYGALSDAQDLIVDKIEEFDEAL